MDSAFEDCSLITALYMLDGILTVGERAFAGMTALESISVPSTVHTLGDGAFAGCGLLTELTLPKALTFAGAGAFADCASLVSVILPMEGECYISTDAFDGCDGITEIIILSPTLVLKSLDFIPDGVEIKCTFTEEEASEEFLLSLGDIVPVYGYEPDTEEEDTEEDGADKDNGGKGENAGSGGEVNAG